MVEEQKRLGDIIKKKQGGQLGNHNARKHGFYSSVLTRGERRSLKKAVDTEGLDNEIDLLRVKIESLVRNDPYNIDLIVRAVNALVRSVLARQLIVGKVGVKDGFDVKGMVSELLKDVALPADFDLARLLKK